MLLRHGKSDWPTGIDDHERPLAKRGQRDSASMGRHMVAQGLLPDLAIISTARRTQETWDLARPAFVTTIAQQNEDRIYESSVGAILDVIHEVDEKIRHLLLVGHNPGLQDLALKLIGKARKSDLARLQQKFPTAGLVVIDLDIHHWSQASIPGGRLERFDTPKSIASE